MTRRASGLTRLQEYHLAGDENLVGQTLAATSQVGDLMMQAAQGGIAGAAYVTTSGPWDLDLADLSIHAMSNGALVAFGDPGIQDGIANLIVAFYVATPGESLQGFVPTIVGTDFPNFSFVVVNPWWSNYDLVLEHESAAVAASHRIVNPNRRDLRLARGTAVAIQPNPASAVLVNEPPGFLVAPWATGNRPTWG